MPGLHTRTQKTRIGPLSRSLRLVYADKAARTGIASVDVESFVRVEREPLAEYRPDDPKANDEGYVYAAAVDTDEEMVEMPDASRNYQNNIEVVTTLTGVDDANNKFG